MEIIRRNIEISDILQRVSEKALVEQDLLAQLELEAIEERNAFLYCLEMELSQLKKLGFEVKIAAIHSFESYVSVPFLSGVRLQLD